MYTVVMLTALCGLVSLGVEVGRVQTAKTELRTAADAAGRAAAVSFLSSGATAARQQAVSAAADNKCDGQSVALDSTQDVEFGTWDAAHKTFTVLSGSGINSANAVRITARRTAARGNPLALSFAKVVGKSTVDIQAQSMVYFSSKTGVSGFVGLSGMSFKNNTFVGSYNSATNPNPLQINSYTHGQIASNGNIDTKNNMLIMGDVVLGPDGSFDGGLVIGSTKKLSSAIAAPMQPPWNPSPNPGGISQAYTVSSAKTLPGGTYYFTSLSIQAPLSFSGPATVYVNGNVTIDDSLTGYQFKPSNLKIYQLGNHTFGDSKGNDLAIFAEIEAPGSDFVVKNNLGMYGSAVFNTFTTKNNALLFYDEQQGSASSSKIISQIQ